MKRAAIAVFAMAMAVAVTLNPVFAQTHAPIARVSELPVSLDSHYPPKAPAPFYLIKMHELATPLSGVASDAMEGDVANAHANYAAFRKMYLEVAEMVPEWKDLFPIAPVDRLGTALESGAPENLMPAMEAVGAACNNCHYKYMPMAYFKYHWDSFDNINVADPVTGADMRYAQFMMVLESDMTGVGLDMQQGQLDAARRHASDFQTRFGALRDACAACHDTERRYYVDASVTGLIDKLNTALSGEAVEPQLVGGLLQQIGQESCSKCHLVHVPSVYSKR